MSPLIKTVLILFGLAYLISPADLIPDLLLPWLVGWLDDSVVLYCIYYLIRYGELPWFAFKKGRKGLPGSRQKKPTPEPDPKPDQKAGPGASQRARRQAPRGQNTRFRHRQPEGSGNIGQQAYRQQNGNRPAAPVKTPYEILGVSPDASWETIQKAHKEKIKQYHPDKLSHLGEDFSNLANEKFLEIQNAYNTLKKKHG